MAVELVVNFALEKALETLFEAIIDVKDKAKEFKPALEKLKSTIEILQPMIKKIEELNRELDQNEGPTKELVLKIQDGQDVVRNCSNVRWWCLCRKREYTNRLLELNESLDKLLQTVPLENAMNLKQILLIHQHINVTVVNQFKSSLPVLPTFTVGLQVPLNELKRRFLREETSVLVVKAPVGCGKTTLAAKFCKDEEVQGIDFRGLISEFEAPKWQILGLK